MHITFKGVTHQDVPPEKQEPKTIPGYPTLLNVGAVQIGNHGEFFQTAIQEDDEKRKDTRYILVILANGV